MNNFYNNVFKEIDYLLQQSDVDLLEKITKTLKSIKKKK